MKKLKGTLALWPVIAFLFFTLNAKSETKNFKVSSEFFEGKKLSPGEFVLDLEKTKQEFKARKETFCSATRLPSDQQKSLEVLSKTNQHICESKRKGKNILEFCSCVTLNSAKEIGGYSPLKKNEMESYKSILEDLAITQSIRQKFYGLFGIALSVQNASTHSPIWKVINRPNEDDLIKECSPEYIGNFMQNTDCEEKGLARMNKVLSKVGLDIFPDQDKKNGGIKFGEILSDRLEKRLGIPAIRSCLKIGEESIQNNSERIEIEEGNTLLFKALNSGVRPSSFSVDDFQKACAFLKHDPFISQKIFSDMRNKSLASGQQDLIKKRSMDCSLPEEAKNITKEWFEVVISDLKKQRKSLFQEQKGEVSPSDFQTILDAHYRESSKEMLSQCRVLKKEILKVCQIAQKDSFSPAEIGFIPGPTSILKASQDIIKKYKKNLPPPPPSDERIKSQMDQLMCFMHGDANGLVSSDAASYAQDIATFAKHEDFESVTGKEDNGSLYEESEEGIKIDQWIAKADNDSRLGLKNDYEKHPDLYPKKEEAYSTATRDTHSADRFSDEVTKKPLDDSKGGGFTPPSSLHQLPSVPSSERADELTSSRSSSSEGSLEKKIQSLEDKQEAVRSLPYDPQYTKVINNLQKEINELKSELEKKQKKPEKDGTASQLSAAEELDQAMADLEKKKKEKSAVNKLDAPAKPRSSSVADVIPLPSKIPNYSASSFEGYEKGKPFNIVPPKKGAISKYASFKDENGKEIVVDLASSDILVLSENQFAKMTEEEFKDWYEKSKGEAIYIMDPSGDIKRAIPTTFGNKLKYMCLNEKEGKFTPIDCKNEKEKVVKVEQVAMTANRPKSSGTGKSKAHSSHKKLVELLQLQTAKRVSQPLAP